MNTVLNYWNVHGIGTQKQLLIIGDAALYDQRVNIEKLLPDDFVATTVSFSANVSCESVLKTVKLFLEQDGISYDTVYFKPESSFVEAAYKKLLDELTLLLPDALWILGLYNYEADSIVNAVADEYGFACGDVNTMATLLTAVPDRATPKDLLETCETIGWIKYEVRSFEKVRPRVLLVGDSIIWGGHEFTANALADCADVNTFVTSFGVNDKRFTTIVETLCSMNDADYDVVYFNNGLHSHGQTPDEYAKNYNKTISALMKCFPKAKWILGLSTPVSENPKSGTQYDTPITEKRRADSAEKNTLACLYNEKVKAIAEKLTLPYLDAYSLMVDKDEWKVDCYHYNEQGRKLFGEAVASKILAEASLSK